MLAIFLSPILVILVVPLAIGTGLDIFDVYGETPLVLLLCLPAAMVFLRRCPLGSWLHWAGTHLRPHLHLHSAP